MYSISTNKFFKRFLLQICPSNDKSCILNALGITDLLHRKSIPIRSSFSNNGIMIIARPVRPVRPGGGGTTGGNFTGGGNLGITDPIFDFTGGSRGTTTGGYFTGGGGFVASG
jgi:hypothetical protein